MRELAWKKLAAVRGLRGMRGLAEISGLREMRGLAGVSGLAVLGGIAVLALCVPVLGSCRGSDGGPQAGAELPLTRVILYQNGVGYFERRGRLTGEILHLRVSPSEVNDLLKSLTVIDLTSPRPSTISLPVEKGGARIEDELPPQTRRAGGLVAMLAALRGAHVELESRGGNVSGRLVGVELPPERPSQGHKAGEEAADGARVTVLEGAGALRVLPLAQVTAVKLRDRALQVGLRRSLDASLSAGNWKPVDVTVEMKGADGHEVLVSYIHEVPVWKAAYRLWVEKDKQPLLQGWAAVHNLGGEPWANVKLSLVAGTPLSFRYDLQTATYISRPDLTPSRPSVAVAPPPSDRGREMSRPTTASAAPAPAPRRPGSVDAKASAMGILGALGGGKSGAALNDALAENEERSKRDEAPPPPPEAKPDLNAIAGSMRRALESTPVGALFRYDVPGTVSVQSGAAALVSLVNFQLPGEDVHLFRPQPGQTTGTVPYRAIRIRNESAQTLEAGPITLYVDGTFVGEGFIERTDPKVTAFVAYAVDPTVTLSLDTAQVDETGRLVKLLGGQVTVEVVMTRKTTFRVENRLDKALRAYVRTLRSGGYTLKAPPAELVTAGEAYFVPIDAPAGKTTEVVLREVSPVRRAVALDSAQAGAAFKLYLQGGSIDEKVAGPIREVLALREQVDAIDRELAALEEKKGILADSQQRVRANLEALPAGAVAAELRKKLVAQLAEDEKGLAKIAADSVKAQVQKAELREKMLSLVRALTLDVK